MIECTLLIFSMNNSFIIVMFLWEKYVIKVLPPYTRLYADSFIISSFSSAINKMLYDGASFQRIVVPRFCFSIPFPNVKTLSFNTTSTRSIIVSVKTYFSFRLLSRFS